jgi:hypothetical protein
LAVKKSVRETAVKQRTWWLSIMVVLLCACGQTSAQSTPVKAEDAVSTPGQPATIRALQECGATQVLSFNSNNSASLSTLTNGANVEIRVINGSMSAPRPLQGAIIELFAGASFSPLGQMIGKTTVVNSTIFLRIDPGDYLMRVSCPGTGWSTWAYPLHINDDLSIRSNCPAFNSPDQKHQLVAIPLYQIQAGRIIQLQPDICGAG